MARTLILFCLIAATAAGCARLRGDGGNGRVEFEGIRFNARLDADEADRRAFGITVTPVAVNPAAALEAGRYEATKYCLRTYGGSDTAWTVGPDRPVDQLRVVEDTITLRGRCTKR